ncbi:MAG: 2-amino-4-hydroxy-6-hydroxymethyldihydropteridine diphosphokinase [Candidatus Methylopumilus sp.]|nr:2-amino-4-hydroxy-6-hydroxymethyldihydropteridine diphosphokinase [Candidatus Methylopumilus sp.]
MNALAYIAVGSNFEDPLNHVLTAFDELAKLPKSELIKKSSCYLSKPQGYVDQPNFINAVVLIKTDLTPEMLLTELQSLENKHGRKRLFPNAPRTLDLDILFIEGVEIKTSLLTIPHARMHERSFVIFPLQEINANIYIPHIGDLAKIAKALNPKSAKRITL